MVCFVFSTLLLSIFDIVCSQALGFQFTLTNSNTIFMFVNAVLFFLAFREMKLKNTWINLFAVDCLAVYIIHMNPIGFSFINNVFGLEGTMGMMIIAKVLGISVVVYAICIGIERVRKRILGNIEDIIASYVVYGGKRCWFKILGVIR